ncbi:transposable element Tc3 transposase [Trichonephila clavata]|uniref:Transposable element Tc3 transposase n=1 Tax=Trichonephila clavata TaxID=2740835 RepID=A0A8X6HUN8_TRICU|nr:transposable element Tc3 transposase [Trichonephila clavata]
MITCLEQRFCNAGSVADRKRSGRPSIVNTKVVDVETTLQKSSMEKSRKFAVQLGISPSLSAWRTARKLNFRQFKMHTVHEMKPPDFEKRLNFCKWFRLFLDTNGIRKLDNVFFPFSFFTDEA